MANMPQEAVLHLREAYALAVQLDGIAKIPLGLLHNLGKAYKESGHYEEAIATLERALKIQENSQERNDLLTVANLVETGSVYRDWGKCEEARPYLQKALSITNDMPWQEDPQSAAIRANVLTNLGLVETDDSHYEAALALQEEALGLLTQGNFSYPPGLAQVEANLGLVSPESRPL